MITDDEVMNLFERADPARAGDGIAVVDAASYLDALRRRSGDGTDASTALLDDTGPQDAGAEVSVVDLDATRRDRTTRRQRIKVAAVAAAATLLLIVGTVLAQRTGDDTKTERPADPRPSPTTVPSPRWRGGLPAPAPEATQTTPKIGEFVASVGWFEPGESYSQAWYLYADGRLISVGNNSGWREQRLTPEGVERVRSELLSTGLFDAEQAPAVTPASSPVPFLCVCVRDGGQVLSAAPDEAETLRLVDYFTQLGSLLPESAWAQRPATEFVASRFAFCIVRTDDVSPHEAVPEPYSVLAGLSARAADLLGDRPGRDLYEFFPGAPGSICFEVTTAEARALREEFVALGEFFEVTEPVSMTVNVSLVGLLPDGTPQMWGG